MGYGPFVKFDHDFIGSDALKKIADKPHRRKVTYAWNESDLGKVFLPMFERGQLQIHRFSERELHVGDL